MRRVTAILAITSFALVLAPSVAAGGGCHWQSKKWTAESSSADEVTAHIVDCRYEPTTLHIEPGTTVTWLNKDIVPHSVTGPFLTLNSDKLMDRGESASVTFDEEGVYPYYCVLHAGMAASVVVGEPTAASTGPLASGNYDENAPVKGSSDEAATEEDGSTVPLTLGVAAIALAGIGGAAFMIRRRRRAVPVPGALP